jgi:hypothetical protein
MNLPSARILPLALLLLVLSVTAGARPRRPVVAAYYFPGFHTDDQIKPDIPQWDKLKAAQPRFGGHFQPRVPMWGYLDESDPAVMAKKINAAADHGIDAFIFDWYWYQGTPFLEKALDNGFLNAPNNSRMKFALMWANHDYGKRTGEVTVAEFDVVCDHIIRDYFLKPNYLLVDGKPYFSIYEMFHFVEGFGTYKRAAEMLNRFREKAKAAGLKGIYFNVVLWGLKVQPNTEGVKDQAALIKLLGIDSVTSYVWIHDFWPADDISDYQDLADGYFKWWDALGSSLGVPCIPNVSVGWDPGPRRYNPNRTIVANTPERFQDALSRTYNEMGRHRPQPHMVTLNAWNEWTEGSYLEPDTVFGNRYLDAVKNVFGLSHG